MQWLRITRLLPKTRRLVLTAALNPSGPLDERRRRRHLTLSPKAILESLSAVVVLERLRAPVLAVGHDGVVVFANPAFADMVGHTPEEVMSLQIHQILRNVPFGESAVAVMKAYADQVVELRYRDGSIVRAHMSESALLRGDDPVAVVVFHDLTEQLWIAGKE
jgi:PAS domain S-box-containing protein